MHFFAPDKNYWGGHGIVAGQTPLGAGLAYGVKYLGQRGSCLCFLGDGAVNQGAFHESLNLAELWDLPVIYVIENNGYSMGTSQERSSAHPEKGLAPAVGTPSRSRKPVTDSSSRSGGRPRPSRK